MLLIPLALLFDDTQRFNFNLLLVILNLLISRQTHLLRFLLNSFKLYLLHFLSNPYNLFSSLLICWNITCAIIKSSLRLVGCLNSESGAYFRAVTFCGQVVEFCVENINYVWITIIFCDCLVLSHDCSKTSVLSKAYKLIRVKLSASLSLVLHLVADSRGSLVESKVSNSATHTVLLFPNLEPKHLYRKSPTLQIALLWLGSTLLSVQYY